LGTQAVKKRRYLQICENKRQDGKVRQKVLGNLGRLEELPKKGQLDKLFCSLARFSTSISCVETPNERKEETGLPEQNQACSIAPDFNDSCSEIK